MRDIWMPRGKNWLPTVSWQFLTLNYPRPNCLIKCLPHCLSPTIEDIFSSFKIALVVRVIARQLSGKNCLAAIFASRHQDAFLGPLGVHQAVIDRVPLTGWQRLRSGVPPPWGRPLKHSMSTISACIVASTFMLSDLTEIPNPPIARQV